jgi:hypothetical protein
MNSSWYCNLKEADYCGTKFSTLRVSPSGLTYIFMFSGLMQRPHRLLVQFTLFT